jgi:hypothetical protein
MIHKIEKRKGKKTIFNFVMTKIIFLCLVSCFFFLMSCSSEIKDNSDQFKKGVFEIPAGKGYGKTIVTRIDSLQIEEYTKNVSISNDSANYERKDTHIDTLYIKWKNNFFYTLRMKSPIKESDKDPIFVQITKITKDSYDFTAKIGFSNFKQDGTLYKVK